MNNHSDGTKARSLINCQDARLIEIKISSKIISILIKKKMNETLFTSNYTHLHKLNKIK